MLWADFLAKLDAIRSEIRATKDVKKETVPDNDPIIDKLRGLANSSTQDIAVFSTKPELLNPFDIPEHTMIGGAVPAPKILEVVERGDGEGRMIVMGRDKPFVPKKPDLQEVLEEELGK